MTEPILIDCEGSGGPGNLLDAALHCRMCHKAFTNTDVIPPHQRDDILARLKRGDYD